MTRYYFDTCIWRDFYEDRFGPRGRPLGKYANALVMKIIQDKDTLLFSDFIFKELRLRYEKVEINNMLNFLFVSEILERVAIYKEDQIEAENIAKERNIPPADVLHAILARNNKAIMVSQDKHFLQLDDIVEVKRPDELI
ncbi:MAG: PIN domain-containing protein [archaeon]